MNYDMHSCTRSNRRSNPALALLKTFALASLRHIASCCFLVFYLLINYNGFTCSHPIFVCIQLVSESGLAITLVYLLWVISGGETRFGARGCLFAVRLLGDMPIFTPCDLPVSCSNISFCRDERNCIDRKRTS